MSTAQDYDESTSVNANEDYYRTALLIVDVQNDFLPPRGSLAVSNGRDILPHIQTLLNPKENWPWKTVVASQDHHPNGHISFITSHPEQSKDKLFKTKTVKSPTTGQDVEQILWPEHCVQSTFGCEIESSIQEALKEWKVAGKYQLIQKGVNKDLDAYSAFASPDTPGARLISDQASSTSTATSSAESSISRRGNGGTPSPTFENTTSCSGSCARLLPSNERPYTSNNRYYSSPLASFLRKKDVERIVICGIATDVCVKATVEDALRCGFQVILVIDAVKGVDEENSKQVLDNFRRNEWVRVVKGIKELKEVLETLC